MSVQATFLMSWPERRLSLAKNAANSGLFPHRVDTFVASANCLRGAVKSAAGAIRGLLLLNDRRCTCDCPPQDVASEVRLERVVEPGHYAIQNHFLENRPGKVR